MFFFLVCGKNMSITAFRMLRTETRRKKMMDTNLNPARYVHGMFVSIIKMCVELRKLFEK